MRYEWSRPTWIVLKRHSRVIVQIWHWLAAVYLQPQFTNNITVVLIVSVLAQQEAGRKYANTKLGRYPAGPRWLCDGNGSSASERNVLCGTAGWWSAYYTCITPQHLQLLCSVLGYPRADTLSQTFAHCIRCVVERGTNEHGLQWQWWQWNWNIVWLVLVIWQQAYEQKLINLMNMLAWLCFR